MLLTPSFGFSQETTNNTKEKPYVTYCNENGSKKLNYIPTCDSLNVSDNNLKITSFEIERVINGKLLNIKENTNRLSGVSKKLLESHKEGIVFFLNIKAINTNTNEEISLPDIAISWDVN